MSARMPQLKRPKQVRVAINVSVGTHRAVKLQATGKGLTIREYILTLVKADGVWVEDLPGAQEGGRPARTPA